MILDDWNTEKNPDVTKTERKYYPYVTAALKMIKECRDLLFPDYDGPLWIASGIVDARTVPCAAGCKSETVIIYTLDPTVENPALDRFLLEQRIDHTSLPEKFRYKKGTVSQLRRNIQTILWGESPYERKSSLHQHAENGITEDQNPFLTRDLFLLDMKDYRKTAEENEL